MPYILLLLSNACFLRSSPADGTGETAVDPATWEPAWNSVGHAIIMVMDGARTDETIWDGTSSASGGPTANIIDHMRQDLFSEGTLLRPAYATGVTQTAEGHAEMVTGVRLPQCNFPSDMGAGTFRPEVPTLFELLTERGDTSTSQVAFIANTPHLIGHTWSLYPGLGEDAGASFTFITQAMDGSGGSEEDASDDDPFAILYTQQRLEAQPSRLVVTNLHDIDRSGHTSPDGSSYVEAIENVDRPLVDFWQWLQTNETYADDTLLVITADHGRHRRHSDQDWMDHGDHCAGCRQIPMFFAGPGIKRGEVLTETWTLDDMSRTVAWMLGVDNPYGSGMLIRSALVNPPDETGREGEVWPERSGALQASQVWTDDPYNQSQVWVDDEPISSLDAIHAEHPRVLSNGARDFLCWRELTVDHTAGDYVYDSWYWQGECRTRLAGAQWQDMAFPEAAVWPFWSPALALDEQDRLWLAYVDNPNASGETSAEQHIRVLRWDEAGGWEGEDESWDEVAYPIDPSLAVEGDDAWVAFVTSDFTLDDDIKKFVRYQRHVQVLHLNWPSGRSPSWSRVLKLEVNDSGMGESYSPYARMEHPALLRANGSLWLAFVAYDADKAGMVVLTRSSDDGYSWADHEILDPGGRVIGYIPPRWAPDGTLSWAATASDGAIEICRWSNTDATTCEQTGSTAIQGLSPSSSNVLVSLYEGDGRWNLQELSR